MSRYLCRLDLGLPSLEDRKLIRAISHVLDAHATFKASLKYKLNIFQILNEFCIIVSLSPESLVMPRSISPHLNAPA
ncbi:hypothetical protein F01_400099 [Burkholderia cenocepacia]|nr:hypothetical protein F01_400099 [Burkholderia cenocepacia]